MNGPIKQATLSLVSLALFSGCDPETASPPVSLKAQASPTASPTPVIPPSVDISGCWREIDAKNVNNPLGSPFQLIKVEPNAFVFQINPYRTKLRVTDYSFQEVNLSDQKPFFPRDMIISSGGISKDLNQLNRTFTNEGSPRIYRRCEVAPTVYIPPGSGAPVPQATPSILTPIPRITPLMPSGPAVAAPTPRPTFTPLAPPPATSGFPLNGPLALPTPAFPTPEPENSESPAEPPSEPLP